MSDFDLDILKKCLFIPLLVLCILILWGPALQCMTIKKKHFLLSRLEQSSQGRIKISCTCKTSPVNQPFTTVSTVRMAIGHPSLVSLVTSLIKGKGVDYRVPPR